MEKQIDLTEQTKFCLTTFLLLLADRKQIKENVNDLDEQETYAFRRIIWPD
jgi:hypothetical protein